MILLFIFFGTVLLLVLMAMNDNGQLHNPPAEELAKYEAIQAEEARQRMGMGEDCFVDQGCNGFDDDLQIAWALRNSPVTYYPEQMVFRDQ